MRYASRKARADVRKRVKGRFVKAGDAYDYDPLNQTRSYWVQFLTMLYKGKKHLLFDWKQSYLINGWNWCIFSLCMTSCVIVSQGPWFSPVGDKVDVESLFWCVTNKVLEHLYHHKEPTITDLIQPDWLLHCLPLGYDLYFLYFSGRVHLHYLIHTDKRRILIDPSLAIIMHHNPYPLSQLL